MLYIADDKEIFLNPLKLIGKGTEGKVYKYKDKAIKIYHKNNPNNQMVNHEESDEILKNIKTTYTILPETGVYTLTGYYCGHQMKYMDFSTEESLVDTKIKDFSDNLHIIVNEDIAAISDENFLMYDLNRNTRFTSKIYIIDSGRYIHVDRAREITNNTYENIYNLNLDMFKEALYELTMKSLGMELEMRSSVHAYVKDLFSDIDNIDRKIDKEETIREYVLKRTR